LDHSGGKEAAVGFGNAQQQEVAVQIRWLIRRDMPDVLAIEQTSFEYAWTEEDFLCCLRQRNCIGMVAERDGKIVGFMVYELHKARLRLLNFAVAPEARRQHVGQQMVRRLIDKLSQQRRREIMLEVRETNLAAQLFFRSMGFLALGVLRDRYDDTTEDAYLMRYVLAGAEDDLGIFTPTNRISEFGLSDAA
jgi:ribosomal-protein-alanine N-acetyltransferase